MGGNLARTSEVGSYPANDFRLYDMAGNVTQLVGDCYVDGYNHASSDVSVPPAEPSGCYQRVMRGGSWQGIAFDLPSGRRSWTIPVFRNTATGFRVARTPGG